MKKPKFFTMPCATNYEYQDGESIETKVARITENREPISDGAPIIYTNRDEGVIPAYNIRTDKWDIAQSAMDAIHKANAARSKDYGKKPESEETLETGTDQEPA